MYMCIYIYIHIYIYREREIIISDIMIEVWSPALENRSRRPWLYTKD